MRESNSSLLLEKQPSSPIDECAIFRSRYGIRIRVYSGKAIVLVQLDEPTIYFYPTKSKNTYKRKSPDDSRKNYPEISIYHYTTITTDVLHTYTQHHLRQADARRVMLQVLKYAIGSCSLYLYFIVWIYLSQLYLFRIQFPSVLLYRTFLILSMSFDVFIWEKFNWVWK